MPPQWGAVRSVSSASRERLRGFREVLVSGLEPSGKRTGEDDRNRDRKAPPAVTAHSATDLTHRHPRRRSVLELVVPAHRVANRRYRRSEKLGRKGHGVRTTGLND